MFNESQGFYFVAWLNYLLYVTDSFSVLGVKLQFQRLDMLFSECIAFLFMKS